MAKSYRKPHQYKRRKPILKSRFFWLVILFLIVFSAVFYFLFLSQTFQTEKIIISGVKKVSEESLKSSIERNLEQKILFLRTKSIVLLSLSKIKKDILNEFPQVAEIEIKRGFPDSLNAIVIERQGAASWCQNERCFLIDKEGIIFEEATSDEKSIKIIDKIKTTPLVLGEKVMQKEDLENILKIAPKLKLDLKIPVKEFVIYPEDKLAIVTEENWEIYFNLKNEIDWQMTKLGAVLEEKIPPEKRKDLEYIELRFGNFAPFKFRD